MNGPPDPKRRGLARLLAGALTLALAAAMAAIVPGTARAATQVCSNQTGTVGGSFFTMFVSGGSACININSGTSYTTTWSGIGDFVGGIGFNPGSTTRSLSFSGSMSASGGTALMSLYGWSTNPLVEYYVIQDDLGGSPALGTHVGTVTSDGATYDLYEHQQVNQPSIQGTATFEQYLAIRQGNHTSGTITFQNYVNAWASHGMNLGTMNYQVLATESFGGGSGSSSVTLGGGGSGGNTVTVTNPGNQSGTVGTAASVQVHATDSGGAALTYSATGLPAGLSVNSSSGLISGTPTTAATSSVTVTAKDSTGATGSTSFTWTISSSGGGGGGKSCTTTATSSISADCFSASKGTISVTTTTDANPSGVDGNQAAQLINGDYLEYTGVNFGTTGSTQFDARVASGAAGGVSGLVEVVLDNPSNAAVGSFALANTGGWSTWKTIPANITKVTGTHNVYLEFVSGAGGNPPFVSLHYFSFPAT